MPAGKDLSWTDRTFDAAVSNALRDPTVATIEKPVSVGAGSQALSRP
jgi:hypothetical protein